MRWSTTGVAYAAKMRQRLPEYLAAHSTLYQVKEVANGLAFLVTGWPDCAERLCRVLYAGIGEAHTTGYSITARAAGDGAILRNIAELEHQHYQKLWRTLREAPCPYYTYADRVAP